MNNKLTNIHPANKEHTQFRQTYITEVPIMSVQSEFKSSKVGQLAERHDREKESREEQAAIPSKGSNREQSSQSANQEGN